MNHCTECGAEFVVMRPTCADCGGQTAEGPSPRFASAGRGAAAQPAAPPPHAPPPAQAKAEPGERPALPPHGHRHCRQCGAEFVAAFADCTDCGAPLYPGEAPAAAPHHDPDDLTALSPDEFEVVGRYESGWAADLLCEMLADAGIATMMVTARGRRMRAPGLAPVGPAPGEHERVEIRVFPEHVDEARQLLADAEPTLDADEVPVPQDGPGAGCGTSCEHMAPHEAEQRVSPIALVLGGLVVAIAIGALVLR